MKTKPGDAESKTLIFLRELVKNMAVLECDARVDALRNGADDTDTAVRDAMHAHLRVAKAIAEDLGFSKLVFLTPFAELEPTAEDRAIARALNANDKGEKIYGGDASPRPVIQE